MQLRVRMHLKLTLAPLRLIALQLEAELQPIFAMLHRP
jgi:hypothetical protein